MRNLLLLVALFSAGTLTTFGQTPAKPTTTDGEQAVKALTQEWLNAEERHDRKTLQRIIAEDFLGTGPGGNSVSREDVLPDEGATSGGLAVTGQSIQVRIFGETAVVTGHGIPKPRSFGIRFTVIFVNGRELADGGRTFVESAEAIKSSPRQSPRPKSLFKPFLISSGRS